MTDSLTWGRVPSRRRALARVYLTEALTQEALDAVLRAPGEILKSSRKSRVRRVDEYLIKESRGGWGLGLLKHTFQRRRYRRGWVAAHFLQERGIGAPRPLAYVEHGFAGIIAGNTMVMEYLEGYSNVEVFLQTLIRRNAGRDTLIAFLHALADAVNALVETGAYHEDLSGKNIVTRDGVHFVFIDLDAVETARAYDDEQRLMNHIQIYDSFCDQLSDTLLVPFLEQMLPPQVDPRVWMPKVRKGQRVRRARTAEKRGAEG